MLLINSNRFCPYDHKRLAIDMGAHDSEGDLEIVHFCLNCEYREIQRPERDRTSDGKSLMERVRDRTRDPKPMTPPAAFEPLIEETQR